MSVPETKLRFSHRHLVERRHPLGLLPFLAPIFLLGVNSPATAQCPTGTCLTSADCNDGRFCTAELCIGGQCVCTLDDEQCADGDFCDGENYCDTTLDACAEGPAPTCTPPLFCSSLHAACVECETSGQCSTPPRLRCNSSGVCVECLSTVQCQDGLFCNGIEICDASSGSCLSGSAVSCSKVCFQGTTPGSICVNDADCGTGARCVGGCSENRLRCVQCELDSECDNGLFCDGSEGCVNDVCVAGNPPDCRRCVGGGNDGVGCSSPGECATGQPPGVCSGAGSLCDEANNRCNVCLSDGHCDDSLACTTDACTTFGGGVKLCKNVANDGLCDDGLHCNGQERCNASLTGCAPGTPVNCVKRCFRGLNAGAACSTDGQCGSACAGGPNPGQACTTDGQCGRACVGQAEGYTDAGAPCLSTSDCSSENCRAGICIPGFCRGSCSEALDACVDCESNSQCSDGLFCDGAETCLSNGTCADSPLVDCSALNESCREGACSEAQDRCAANAVNEGLFCVGSDHCSAVYECSGGNCLADLPAANDPFRCLRMEWRPTTQQTVTLGQTVTLSLYAVADQCNLDNPDCPSTAAALHSVAALLNWNQTHLQLQPSSVQSPNPTDACDHADTCNQCQVCLGGSNPGAPCTQRCVGGSFHAYPCTLAAHCPGGQCYGGPVCEGGTNDGNPCTTNAQCTGMYCDGGTNAGGLCATVADCPGFGSSCVAAKCPSVSEVPKCLGAGTCGAPPSYNWLLSGFPNDCSTSAMNGPCPSSGFPGNDGGAYYRAERPAFCGGPHNYPARPACATSAGLKITDFRFRAIAVPPGGGTTNVTFASCGPFPLRTNARSAQAPPTGYTTDDILKTIGPPASLRILACAGSNDCVDGDPCTTDACVGGLCENTPLECGDSDPCTTDYCAAGMCHNDPVSCGAGQICFLGLCYDPCTTTPDCSDGVDCTVDVCDNENPPLPGVCRYTPNDALCVTGEFCHSEHCDAALGCVADYECVGTTGNPCPNPALCDEETDTCGGCKSPSVQALGSRYLQIIAGDQGATEVALKVVGDCGDPQSSCVSSYVQSLCDGGSNQGNDCDTDADCPKACSPESLNAGTPCAANSECQFGFCRGRCDTRALGPVAYFKSALQWGVVKVRGAQIRPGANYLIEQECDFPPLTRSAGSPVRTWRWGDLNGDGSVDAIDVVRVVDAFRGIYGGGATFEQVNHWGCTPDELIDALDITLEIDSFRGLPYPCGVVCP